MAHSSNSKERPQLIFRPVGGAILLIVFLLLMWSVGRAGVASLLTAYAAKSNNISAANAAVGISPGNPDAHYVRGTILEGTNDLPGGVDEYQKAALARPDDYVCWLSLARARELNGETEGAVAAARHAIPLAPYYSQPHYQLGNILLRAGKKDEAFKELSLAGASNPKLMEGVIDLAWRVSGGSAQFVQQAIAPVTPEAYLALGEYFRQRKEVGAAIAMYIAAGGAGEQARRSYLAELIGAKQFKEAATLWTIGRTAGASAGILFDPGFDQESNLKDPGFGWRLGENDKGLDLSLDTNNPRGGRSSLKVEFGGDSNPSSPVISQLVLVEPDAHYQLRFAFRSEGIVSGGLPLVVVKDADADRIVGQSGQFPKATDGWSEYTVEFNSGQSTSAVQIALQRQACDRSPCPIFGRVWLDDFSLQKL